MKFVRPLVSLLVVINTTIFLLLSVLHFYWAFGGKLWLDAVLPTNSSGTQQLNPTTTAALIIAFGLLCLALVTLGNRGLFDKYLKRNYFRYGVLAIAIVFFLRAIGDFRFIGFFKIVTATRFGANDTQIFSPLCVFIGLLSLLIFICGRNKA